MKTSLLRAVAVSAIISFSAAPAFALDTGVSGSTSGSAGVSGSSSGNDSDTGVGADVGVDAGVNADVNTDSDGASATGSADVSGSGSASASINEDDVDPTDPFGELEVDVSGDLSADAFDDEELAEIRARCGVITENSDRFDASASAWCDANAGAM